MAAVGMASLLVVGRERAFTCRDVTCAGCARGAPTWSRAPSAARILAQTPTKPARQRSQAELDQAAGVSLREVGCLAAGLLRALELGLDTNHAEQECLAYDGCLQRDAGIETRSNHQRHTVLRQLHALRGGRSVDDVRAQARVLAQQAEALQRSIAQPALPVLARNVRAGHARQHRVGRALQQLVLVADVVVQRHRRHAEVCGQAAHAQVLGALALNQGQGGVHDSLLAQRGRLDSLARGPGQRSSVPTEDRGARILLDTRCSPQTPAEIQSNYTLYRRSIQ